MKIREITPAEYACGIGACPCVFVSDRGSLLIVGAERDASTFGLAQRVGPGENLIEIDLALIAKALEQRQT